MRESSFAFPGQNKACVCITSQLYDRRALDTPSPLALFNSLTHLVYLTSTSPRIREIMTMDGGLERLVRMLHHFVLNPPLPESSSLIFGLSPPSSTTRHLNNSKDIIPAHYDKAAAHRFSLAFQCLVNIGVRGSEPIRSRVVQAGTLDVVGCILEAWLVQRGFPNPVTSTGTNSGTNLIPSSSRGQARALETREQRHARRAARAQLEQLQAMQAVNRHSGPEDIARFWAFANANPPPFTRRTQLNPPGLPAPAIPPPPPSGIAMTAAQRDQHLRGARPLQNNATNPTPPSPTRSTLPRQQRPPQHQDPPAQQQTARPTSIHVIQPQPEQSNASRINRSNTLRPRSSTIRPTPPPTSSPSPPPSQTHSPSPVPNSEDSDSSIHHHNREEDTTTDDEAAPRPRRRTATLIAGNASGGTATPTRVAPANDDAHIIISSGADTDSVGLVGGGGLNDVDGVTIGAAGGVGGGAVSIGLPAQNDDLAMGAPPGAPGALPITRPPPSRMASHNTEESSGTESERERDGEMRTTPSSSSRQLPPERMGMGERSWSDNDITGNGPSTASTSHHHQSPPPPPVSAASDTELPTSSFHSHFPLSHHGTHREAEDIDVDRDRMEVEETPRAGSIALPLSSSLDERDGSATIRGTPPSAPSTSTAHDRGIPFPPPPSIQAYRNAHPYNTTPHQISSPTNLSIFRSPTASTSRTVSTATVVRATPSTATIRAGPTITANLRTIRPANATAIVPGAPIGATSGHSSQEREREGPYRDDDVLLSLQLLAYLSKYPHVRQAFYVRRAGFHPATVSQNLANAQESLKQSQSNNGKGKEKEKEQPSASSSAAAPTTTSPAKEKEKSFLRALASSATVTTTSSNPPPKKSHTPGQPPPPGVPRETNVFALVERFTFRGGGIGANAKPEPRMPNEIQYWAGVIMRNACRKDESKGGVRQCANMLCGKWESYPREFAKCRRCRKAKYCGKECQSLAWSEGHRFWCSAKSEGEDAGAGEGRVASGTPQQAQQGGITPVVAPGVVNPFEDTDRETRETERERRALEALGFLGGGLPMQQQQRVAVNGLPPLVVPPTHDTGRRRRQQAPMASPTATEGDGDDMVVE